MRSRLVDPFLPWITVRDVEAASGLPQMAPTLLIGGQHRSSPTLAGRQTIPPHGREAQLASWHALFVVTDLCG
jgi:hypothetical protein